jgi:hypothetical protein
MKIEVQEKFIKVTPDEGKLLYNKVKPNSLMKEIYLPKKFTEAQINEKYAEISAGLFDGTEQEPVKKLTDMRFSKLAVKGKLKELGLWDGIKEQLSEDEYEDLLIADDFAFDNELFVRVYESLKIINSKYQ